MKFLTFVIILCFFILYNIYSALCISKTEIFYTFMLIFFIPIILTIVGNYIFLKSRDIKHEYLIYISKYLKDRK